MQGLIINPLYNCIKFKGSDDPNLKKAITFTVMNICDNFDDTNCDDAYNNIAIYGRLRLINGTSECQPNCEDGRIYPMEVPIWYASYFADKSYLSSI